MGGRDGRGRREGKGGDDGRRGDTLSAASAALSSTKGFSMDGPSAAMVAGGGATAQVGPSW